jgi:predicted dehydrogenase
MKGKLRIGIVGAGKRVHQMYAPVLATNHDIEVSGFWNRDASKAQLAVDAFGYQRYTDLDKLAKESEALIIAVNSNALTEVTLRCIEFGKPLLVETPVWTKDVLTAATTKGIPLAIAEQTPYLPSEQIKMEILRDKKTFGIPHTVINDFRTFEYHGIAQLRRYIGYDKMPVEVCGMSHGIPMMPFLGGDGSVQRHIENWDCGQIRFASGEIAVYNFSSLYNRCWYRSPRSLRIYTDRATISNTDNNFSIRVGFEDASSQEVIVTINTGYGEKTKSLDAHWNHNGNHVASWRPLTDHLTDQQEALKVIVDNFADHIITSGGQKLIYDVAQGWTDWNLLCAIRASSQNKRYISR